MFLDDQARARYIGLNRPGEAVQESGVHLIANEEEDCHGKLGGDKGTLWRATVNCRAQDAGSLRVLASFAGGPSFGGCGQRCESRGCEYLGAEFHAIMSSSVAGSRTIAIWLTNRLRAATTRSTYARTVPCLPIAGRRDCATTRKINPIGGFCSHSCAGQTLSSSCPVRSGLYRFFATGPRRSRYLCHSG